MATLSAIRVRHLSEFQNRAFVIGDNWLAELASWDEELLKKELKFLTECDIDIDFSAIDFETSELDIVLNEPIWEMQTKLNFHKHLPI